MEDKPKEYEINTLSDIVDTVTLDKLDAFAEDFKSWLHLSLLQYDLIRLQLPKECEGKKNSEIAECEMVWIDDGTNEIKGITIKLKEN